MSTYPALQQNDGTIREPAVTRDTKIAHDCRLCLFNLRTHYFATATASSNFTERSLETPSAPIVTP